MNSNTILKWGSVVHKHRRAERRYWWMWTTDTFLCSLCFYSVLSLILFATLERQEKEGMFEKLQEKPNCWNYEFVLVSLCLSSKEYSKVTTIKCFSDICTCSLTCCGFFSISVCVDFLGWEIFCYLLVGLLCFSKDVSFDQQIVPGAW